MITLIAEKPSVGMELARLTGCSQRREGYMEGGTLQGQKCCVTWALGHLCQMTEDPSTQGLHWKEENLPVIPPRFVISPRQGKDRKGDAACLRQLAVIERLFEKTDTIVNCGDAGREGEVIQRWIYDYVCSRNPRCRKPVKRLWISSMTDEAIREGLARLRPAEEYTPLYLAGKARAEADWLVGINATEALTLTVKRAKPLDRRVFSLGRVQTPTLALVCSRYLENKHFVPQPYWTVKLTSEKDGIVFHVTSDRRFDNAEAAIRLAAQARQSVLEAVSAEHKPRRVSPPLLHDQTSLQQEASKRYDMSPDETLATAQKLYEMKLITYPRTGSQFIPRDVLRTIPERIQTLAMHGTEETIRSAATRMSSLGVQQLGRGSVNDGKVTDHHALLVERTRPGRLETREERIYNLIAERMLEAFSAPCDCDVFSVRLVCQGEEFSASTTKIIYPGWKTVRGVKESTVAADTDKVPDDSEADRPTEALPEIKADDRLRVLEAVTADGMTQPKPIYTYNTLLGAMKTAGKQSDNNDVKAALKNIGIGTDATRAGILKMLLDTRHYIRKEGKKIVPTETGLEVYNLVKDMSISDVDLTGEWEIALSAIADGQMDSVTFEKGIHDLTREVTRQILGSRLGDGIGSADDGQTIKCPCCGSEVRVWDTYAKCTGKECGLSTNRTVLGRKLAIPTIKRLLETGKTGIVKGFISPKTGKRFDGRLQLRIVEKDGRRYANAEIQFDNTAGTRKQRSHEKR